MFLGVFIHTTLRWNFDKNDKTSALNQIVFFFDYKSKNNLA